MLQGLPMPAVPLLTHSYHPKMVAYGSWWQIPTTMPPIRNGKIPVGRIATLPRGSPGRNTRIELAHRLPGIAFRRPGNRPDLHSPGGEVGSRVPAQPNRWH